MGPVLHIMGWEGVLTVSLPNEAKGKFRVSLQISFCKILKNK